MMSEGRLLKRPRAPSPLGPRKAPRTSTSEIDADLLKDIDAFVTSLEKYLAASNCLQRVAEAVTSAKRDLSRESQDAFFPQTDQSAVHRKKLEDRQAKADNARNSAQENLRRAFVPLLLPRQHSQERSDTGSEGSDHGSAVDSCVSNSDALNISVPESILSQLVAQQKETTRQLDKLKEDNSHMQQTLRSQSAEIQSLKAKASERLKIESNTEVVELRADIRHLQRTTTALTRRCETLPTTSVDGKDVITTKELNAMLAGIERHRKDTTAEIKALVTEVKKVSSKAASDAIAANGSSKALETRIHQQEESVRRLAQGQGSAAVADYANIQNRLTKAEDTIKLNRAELSARVSSLQNLKSTLERTSELQQTLQTSHSHCQTSQISDKYAELAKQIDDLAKADMEHSKDIVGVSTALGKLTTLVDAHCQAASEESQTSAIDGRIKHWLDSSESSMWFTKMRKSVAEDVKASCGLITNTNGTQDNAKERQEIESLTSQIRECRELLNQLQSHDQAGTDANSANSIPSICQLLKVMQDRLDTVTTAQHDVRLFLDRFQPSQRMPAPALTSAHHPMTTPPVQQAAFAPSQQMRLQHSLPSNSQTRAASYGHVPQPSTGPARQSVVADSLSQPLANILLDNTVKGAVNWVINQWPTHPKAKEYLQPLVDEIIAVRRIAEQAMARERQSQSVSSPVLSNTSVLGTPAPANLDERFKKLEENFSQVFRLANNAADHARDANTDIRKLRDKLETLQNDVMSIAGIKTELAKSSSGSPAPLGNALPSSVKKDIAELKHAHTTLEQSLLQSQDSSKDQISALMEDLRSCSQRLEKLESRVAADSANAGARDLEAIRADMREADKRNETAYASLRDSHKSLSDDLDDLKKRHPNLPTSDAKVIELEKGLQAVKNEIQTVQGSFQAYKQSQAAVIERDREAWSELKETLPTLEGRIEGINQFSNITSQECANIEEALVQQKKDVRDELDTHKELFAVQTAVQQQAIRRLENKTGAGKTDWAQEMMKARRRQESKQREATNSVTPTVGDHLLG